ncbi:MAG: hypothetical protein RI519_02945 [Balneolaceae bacterium]|nr:hypothetical protein [Balneolaceae bacterium]
MTSLLNEISALWNHFVDPPRELTLTELAELDMPDPLRVRIVATVQHQARTATIQADSEWLDMNHPNVYIDWMNFVTDHLPYAKIPQAYVRTVFDSALEDLVECCVHPRTAIVDLCFGERTERSFVEVELASRAIPVHEDLVKGMIAAVGGPGLGSDADDPAQPSGDPAQQSGDSSQPSGDSSQPSGQMIQKNDAQAAIEQADQALFNGVTGTELANLVIQRLEPLFELCKDSVDPTFLSTFVEEKGYDELAQVIEESHDPLSKEEFVALVSQHEQTLPQSRSQSVTQPVPPLVAEDDQESDISTPLGSTEEPEQTDDSPADELNTLAGQASQPSEGTPLWMQYLQDVPEDVEGDVAIEDDSSVATPADEPSYVTPTDTTLATSAPTPDQTPTQTPAEKLLEHLKPIQPKITKSLFQDEYGQYLDMIQSVCELPDWETAAQWLDDHVFVPQNIDLEDETVITFLDRMQAYFE